MPTKPPTHQPFGAQSPKQRERAYDRQRGSRQARGYDATWEAFRLSWLRGHPLCEACKPLLTPATVVDHIIPHRGDRELFWRDGNHQSLCESHHNAKTGRGQ